MQQSGILYILSRAGDVTNSTFKDKPLAGTLTHILWQTHLRVTLEEPAGHLLCQTSWQGSGRWVSGWQGWKNTKILRKRHPPFSSLKEFARSPPKYRTMGLKSRQGTSGKSQLASRTRDMSCAACSAVNLKSCPAIAQSSEGQRLALLISQRHFTVVNWHPW